MILVDFNGLATRVEKSLKFIVECIQWDAKHLSYDVFKIEWTSPLMMKLYLTTTLPCIIIGNVYEAKNVVLLIAKIRAVDKYDANDELVLFERRCTEAAGVALEAIKIFRGIHASQDITCILLSSLCHALSSH